MAKVPETKAATAISAITPLNIHPVSSSMAASCMLRIGPLPQVGREMVKGCRPVKRVGTLNPCNNWYILTIRPWN